MKIFETLTDLREADMRTGESATLLNPISIAGTVYGQGIGVGLSSGNVWVPDLAALESAYDRKILIPNSGDEFNGWDRVDGEWVPGTTSPLIVFENGLWRKVGDSSATPATIQGFSYLDNGLTLKVDLLKSNPLSFFSENYYRVDEFLSSGKNLKGPISSAARSTLNIGNVSNIPTANSYSDVGRSYLRSSDVFSLNQDYTNRISTDMVDMRDLITTSIESLVSDKTSTLSTVSSDAVGSMKVTTDSSLDGVEALHISSVDSSLNSAYASAQSSADTHATATKALIEAYALSELNKLGFNRSSTETITDLITPGTGLYNFSVPQIPSAQRPPGFSTENVEFVLLKIRLSNTYCHYIAIEVSSRSLSGFADTQISDARMYVGFSSGNVLTWGKAHNSESKKRISIYETTATTNVNVNISNLAASGVPAGKYIVTTNATHPHSDVPLQLIITVHDSSYTGIWYSDSCIGQVDTTGTLKSIYAYVNGNTLSVRAGTSFYPPDGSNATNFYIKEIQYQRL